MKKSFKVAAIAAIAVCLVGLGAYAKVKFVASAVGYYQKSGTSNCVEIDAIGGATPFDTKGASDTQAYILDANGTTHHLVFTDANCQTAAKFVP